MPILRTNCSATYTTPSLNTVSLPINCAGADSEDWNWKYYWVKTLGTSPVKVQAQDSIGEPNCFMYVEGSDTVGAGENYQIVIRSMFAYIADEPVPIYGAADMYMEFFSNTPLLDSTNFEIYTKVFNLDGSLVDTIFDEDVVVSNPATFTVNGSEQRTFSGYLPATTCPLVCFSWMRSVGVATPPIESKTVSGNFRIDVDAALPEIEVKAPDESIINANDTKYIGLVDLGYSKSFTFTIKNNGGFPLNLTGNPKVAVSGVNASEFTITVNPSTSIAAGTTTSFTLQCTPSGTGVGTRYAQLSIPNGDIDKNPFVFNIYVSAYPPPDIGVDNIPNNGTYDFGLVGMNSVIDKTFTISNAATDPLSSTLHLTGSPRVEVIGPNANKFWVKTQPSSVLLAPIGSGSSLPSSTSFTVQYSSGTAAGEQTAQLSISNNDPDENPFIINLKATIPAYPEISVESPYGTDIQYTSVNLGSVVQTSYINRTFYIFNTGNATLNLTGTPKILINGGSPENFSITSEPSSSIVSGGFTTFVVRFDPVSSGTKTTVLSIPNNDLNENPYNISISATAT